MNTEEKLNRLAEMKAAVDAIRLHYEDLRKQVIPPEIQQLLDEIDEEAQTALSIASDGIGNLEAEIKADVIQAGATIKGASLMAVWNKGRVTWDTKGIEGFAVAHPEINTFRKEGDPSVTIRAK